MSKITVSDFVDLCDGSIRVRIWNNCEGEYVWEGWSDSIPDEFGDAEMTDFDAKRNDAMEIGIDGYEPYDY